jgi:hypothetical protein
MSITAPLLHCGKSAIWVGLERQIDTSSQNLAAREAAFRHAEFIAAQARAQFSGLPRSRPSPDLALRRAPGSGTTLVGDRG